MISYKCNLSSISHRVRDIAPQSKKTLHPGLRSPSPIKRNVGSVGLVGRPLVITLLSENNNWDRGTISLGTRTKTKKKQKISPQSLSLSSFSSSKTTPPNFTGNRLILVKVHGLTGPASYRSAKVLSTELLNRSQIKCAAFCTQQQLPTESIVCVRQPVIKLSQERLSFKDLLERPASLFGARYCGRHQKGSTG